MRREGSVRRLIIKMMLALLVMGVLTLVINIQLVNAEISATAEFPIAMLNLKSRGRLVGCYIELPEGYSLEDINVSTIMLNNTVPVDLEAPISIGDYDNDNIPDLMVNFNRTEVIEFISSQHIRFSNVTITLTGSLHDGTSFEANAVITVSSFTGDVNCDGTVNFYDLVKAATTFGFREGETKWNPNANFAQPWNEIDVYDLITVVINFTE
jgi:hypothetical protein